MWCLFTENAQLEQIIIDSIFFSHVPTVALILSQPSDSCQHDVANTEVLGGRINFQTY